MSKTSRFTYLLLAGCFLLICFSAYMLITQARDLAAAREELRETRLELAQKQSQLLVVGDALTSNQDLAEMMSGASGIVARACSDQQSAGEQVRTLCGVAQWASSPFGRFLAAYAGVAARRVAAETAGDWNEVKAGYQQLQSLLPRELDPGRRWAARIDEGIAYSEYRLGRFDEAQRYVNRAAGLDSRSAFVGLTRLKIACARGAPEERVQRLFSRQLDALEESIANPAVGMNEKYARLELDYFTNDAELEFVCSYAEL